MCPCPICTSIALLLCPLLLFKKPREWVKKKIRRHHIHCAECQQLEHKKCQAEHIRCTCQACKKKRKK